jgi:hypothetical protein
MPTREPLPPPPRPPGGADPAALAGWLPLVQRWLEKVYRRTDAALQLAWAQLDTAGSRLEDLDERPHSALQDVALADPLGTDAATPKHLTDAVAKAGADHRNQTSGAHGATGALIGAGDLATGVAAGVVFRADAVADLNLAASDPPTQGQVQAIGDKVDELLSRLRAAGLLTP